MGHPSAEHHQGDKKTMTLGIMVEEDWTESFWKSIH
jgi:hypothetical protein